MILKEEALAYTLPVGQHHKKRAFILTNIFTVCKHTSPRPVSKLLSLLTVLLIRYGRGRRDQHRSSEARLHGGI